MDANCSFSINLKGESSQEERRGREENGKREGKGSSKCSLLLLSYLMFSFFLSVIAIIILKTQKGATLIHMKYTREPLKGTNRE